MVDTNIELVGAEAFDRRAGFVEHGDVDGDQVDASPKHGLLLSGERRSREQQNADNGEAGGEAQDAGAQHGHPTRPIVGHGQRG